MNKIKIILLFVFISFLAFASNVNAQPITIHHIDPWANDNVDSKPGSGVNVVNEDRDPTLLDVLDAMKKKRKVTLYLAPSAGATHSWAVRVVGVNLTSYNDTNWTKNFMVLYDPTSHAYINTTGAVIGNSTNSTGYVYAGGEWRKILGVTMVYKTPKPGSGLFHVKPGHYGLLPLMRFRDLSLALPKFH